MITKAIPGKCVSWEIADAFSEPGMASPKCIISS